MPYLIRSKGRRIRLRDGALATDPIYELDDKRDVLFSKLVPGPDAELEIREVVSAEGIVNPEPVNRKPAEAAAPAVDGAEPAADVPAEAAPEPKPEDEPSRVWKKHKSKR